MKEEINYKALVKELRRKLVKHEKIRWKNEKDFGVKCYNRGNSECASHFIQLIDDWKSNTYNEINY